MRNALWTIEVPKFQQKRDHTCGLACVRYLLAHKNMKVNESDLVDLFKCTKDHGVLPQNMINGLRSIGVSCSDGHSRGLSSLKRGALLLTDYDKYSHWISVQDIGDEHSCIFCPWDGLQKIPNTDLEKDWKMSIDGNNYNQYFINID